MKANGQEGGQKMTETKTPEWKHIEESGVKVRGIRYREHPSRKIKQGAVSRPERYYAIRFMDKVEGKIRQESVGWESEGVTLEEVKKLLQELKTASRTGEGPKTFKEKRAKEKKRRDAEEIRRLSFGKFYDETYKPWAQANKAANTYRTEELLYTRWIKPVLQDIPLADISPVAIERIKLNMAKAEKSKTPGKPPRPGKSARTIVYTLAVIRQVINEAKKRNVFSGENVVSRVKKPKVDNAKLRYLTSEELDLLFGALRGHSKDVADQAILSASCGLRFGETAALEWTDVNFENKTLAIRDAKTGSRTVFMNADVETMLQARDGTKKRGLVFPDENGNRQARMSKTFQRVADELFNEGVDDRRLRVTPHTLRHTFGSLLYQATSDLHLTGKALGHKTLTMAQRYAKMSETKLRHAFDTMGQVIKAGQKKENNVINLADHADKGSRKKGRK
jgi:integrase